MSYIKNLILPFNPAFVYLAFAVLLLSMIPVISNAQDISNTSVFKSNTEDIYNNPLTPAFGNPNGDVTIVEYFDYLCFYCKDEEKGLEKLLQEDNNLKIIYKDVPKHGSLSVTAAIATLASMRQGADKYLMFHNALMNKNLSLAGEEMIYQVAGSVGLDVNKLKRDMSDNAFANQIQDNIAVGKSIGVRITPTFIIGGYFFPGDSGYDKLKQMVDYVRSNSKGT